MATIKKVYKGPTALKAIYAGDNKVFDFTADTTAPTTTPRPVAGTYTSAQTVYLDVNEPCTTYYTTDGSTPAVGGATTKTYTAAIVLNSTTTLKYFSVDQAGNVEAVKTSLYTIDIPAAAPANTWRYMKIEGYGAAETGQEVTSRIVEFEAYVGTTNRMTNAATTILSNDPISAGSTNINTIKDGVKTGTSNTYPLWWTSPTPNANIVIDFGAQYTFTKLSYYGYSISGVQRTNRFKILGSNTNNGTDWQTIWDNSTGQAGLQGILPLGYDKTL